MWKERAEKAEAEVIQLRADVQELRKRLNEYREIGNFPPNGGIDAFKEGGTGPIRSLPADAAQYDLNFIYSEIKHRAQSDPGILQLLATRPELRVEVEPVVLEVEGKTLRGGITLLLHRGFFSITRNGYAVFNELQRLGRKTAKRTVYDELDRIAELGFLTKEENGFLATDLKVSVKR